VNEPTTDSQDEVFDVVDEYDNVIAQATRGEVHAQKLLHRAVSIFVFNTKGELLLQLRSSTKDEYANCYTSSASGHLDTGEDYETAAVRELHEELQLSPPLVFLTKLPASPKTANEHTALYETTTDDSPIFHPTETAGGEFASLESISQRIAENPEQFTPPFRELIKWYLAERENRGL
jgi:16S rRNA (adenine1518-N6/adenine1519-N6)-dimethyltransferase